MMCNKREKMSLLQVAQTLPDDSTAEQWFIQNRWTDGVTCAHCGSHRVTERKTAKRRTWNCKHCRKDFTTKTGTLMQGSNLGFRTWALAIYLVTTNLKGIASTKIASDLGITQKSAWHLTMRIREAYNLNHDMDLPSGLVEIDETYIGGKERNKHANKRVKGTQGKSTKTKSVVLGIKQRGGEIRAMPIADTTTKTTHKAVRDNVEAGSQLYTDDARHWTGGVRGYKHQSVNHSAKQYVDGMAHTNSIESFWALLKRGYYGTHHSMSRKHLARYVNEFAGRHNTRKQDTITQMESVASNMRNKRLRYKDLVA